MYAWILHQAWNESRNRKNTTLSFCFQGQATEKWKEEGMNTRVLDWKVSRVDRRAFSIPQGEHK